MSTLSYAQLEKDWIANGGDPAAAPVAAAVAEAESSGRTDATSSNPDGGTNVGLWQLDTPGGKGAGYSISQLENPDTNAAVAVAGSSNGHDWSAWQTYVQGTYKQFLNGKDAAAASSSSSSGSGGGTFSNVKWYEPWTWGNAPGDAATSVERFAVHYGAIALAVVAGGVLVVLGIKRATGIHPPNPIAQAQQAAPAIAAAAL